MAARQPIRRLGEILSEYPTTTSGRSTDEFSSALVPYSLVVRFGVCLVYSVGRFSVPDREVASCTGQAPAVADGHHTFSQRRAACSSGRGRSLSRPATLSESGSIGSLR